MARFEVTISTGEKVLVDHEAKDMDEILAALETHRFLLFSEVRTGGVAPLVKDLVITSSQITLLRAVREGVTQSSTFRGKR